MKEALEYPNDYIVLQDFLYGQGFQKTLDALKHIYYIKVVQRTEKFISRVVISFGINEEGKSIYMDKSKPMFVELQIFVYDKKENQYFYEEEQGRTAIKTDYLTFAEVLDKLKEAIKNAEAQIPNV